MEDRAEPSTIQRMPPAPVRLLLLEANAHAARRIVESLGPGFAVARHATLAAAEQDLASHLPDCVLCGPEAAASVAHRATA